MTELRKIIKERRIQLSPAEIHNSAIQVTERIINHALFQQSKHVGFYWAHKGELDTALLIKNAWQFNKTTYLPSLHNTKQFLYFSSFDQHSEFIINRYGIYEPSLNIDRIIPPSKLDIVFVPLVAFDENCHRIGMGKGYYDRTFAFTKSQPQKPRPTLIGLAYEWQKIPAFTAMNWDIPMDMIITDIAAYTRNL